MAAEHVLHMQKALDQMNLQIHRVIALLDRSVKRVHVCMDDFSHNLLATILFRLTEQGERVSGDR
jgi:hypothetical protein